MTWYCPVCPNKIIPWAAKMKNKTTIELYCVGCLTTSYVRIKEKEQ